MFNSKGYWIRRYGTGGKSDPGSYNETASFKAKVINNFIEKNKINSIIDYGVGDGTQLKLINTKNKEYTGIDISDFILSKCREIFKDDKTKKFINTDNLNNELKADLVLSCSVICYLIEDNVYKEYMKRLFLMSNKYVIIYAPNQHRKEAIYLKHREFVEYIFDNFTEYNLVERIKGNIGYPFYIFQKNNTYTPTISKNILHVTKEKAVDSIVVNKIKSVINDYDYQWFNYDAMYKYIQNYQLEEFPK